jgi:hypothetical protein
MERPEAFTVTERPSRRSVMIAVSSPSFTSAGGRKTAWPIRRSGRRRNKRGPRR